MWPIVNDAPMVSSFSLPVIMHEFGNYKPKMEWTYSLNNLARLWGFSESDTSRLHIQLEYGSEGGGGNCAASWYSPCEWRGSWCGDSGRNCAASAGALWYCNGWCGYSEESGGDLTASYCTLVREARRLAFDNRNSSPRFIVPCPWPHLRRYACVAIATIILGNLPLLGAVSSHDGLSHNGSSAWLSFRDIW